jgi:protein transport protein SEC13
LVNISFFALNIYIYIYLNTSFLFRSAKFFQNDSLGCNSVSWAPFNTSTSLKENGDMVRRLVTGSCDNAVRVWRSTESSDGTNSPWIEESKSGVVPHNGKFAIIM